MMLHLSDTVTRLCDALASSLGTDRFFIISTISIVLARLVCGAVGAPVIGNRMAFFCDALAHCAWAGLSFALLSILLFGIGDNREFVGWLLPAVMIATGCVFGVGIAYVRRKTSLASDTVIGVFFAAALGIGVLTFPALK